VPRPGGAIAEATRVMGELLRDVVKLDSSARDKRTEHKQYIVEHGDDMPEVRDWKWPG
jgi:xylulose-5-phosphate/fructose-6-phosphate phosphoketolase